MALVVEFVCSKCNKHSQMAIGCGSPTPTVCNSCNRIQSERLRRQYFSGLDGLTIEERLRNIEEWIYDYRPPKDINDVRY